MTTVETDKLESARRQGQAQFDSIKEMIEELQRWNTPIEDRNGRLAEQRMDDARQRIEEDALSVEVRSGWYSPGARDADTKPAEYNILLCTGGPACRIIGRLSEYGEPETAELQVQDWFTPWTAMRPLVAPDDYDSEPVLLDYAR